MQFSMEIAVETAYELTVRFTSRYTLHVRFFVLLTWIGDISTEEERKKKKITENGHFLEREEQKSEAGFFSLLMCHLCFLPV